MTEPSAPLTRSTALIAELEAELESALRACPERQHFEVEALRKRVALARAAVDAISRSTVAPTFTTSRKGRV